MTAHAFPEIYVSELEGHRFVSMRQIGMTLKEKVDSLAPLSSRNQKSVLRSLYVVVRVQIFQSNLVLFSNGFFSLIL